MFLETVVLAFKSLLNNKLRSTLSILGVIIGVFTIVLVISISRGVENIIDEQLKFLSVTSIFVEISDTITAKSKLDSSDTYDVLRKSKNVMGATTMELGKGNIIGNNTTEVFNIIGTTETFDKVMSFEIGLGNYFDNKDVVQNKKVVVIGDGVVSKVFRGNMNVIGKYIYVGSTKFKIVGVIKNAPAIPGFNLNDAVYIPYTTSKKFVLGETSMMALVFLAKDIDSVTEAVEDIRRILREKHKLRNNEVDDFNIYEQKTMIQAIDIMLKAISFLIIGVAGIILVVSGIGIMNVMFAGVAEKIKDIGIMRAIGARKIDIMRQFLIESIILTFVGGIVGVVLGELFIVLVNVYSPDVKLVNSLFGNIFALGFALTIGIFFGLYPAKKATKLDVVESLK
ncbi:MAG: ABC transporter permease [Candidatus Gracilibacteria bacterium]